MRGRNKRTYFTPLRERVINSNFIKKSTMLHKFLTKIILNLKVMWAKRAACAQWTVQICTFPRSQIMRQNNIAFKNLAVVSWATRTCTGKVIVWSQFKQEILTISLKVLDGFNGESGKTNEDKNLGFSNIDFAFNWARDGIFIFFMLSLFNFWRISKVPRYSRSIISEYFENVLSILWQFQYFSRI